DGISSRFGRCPIAPPTGASSNSPTCWGSGGIWSCSCPTASPPSGSQTRVRQPGGLLSRVAATRRVVGRTADGDGEAGAWIAAAVSQVSVAASALRLLGEGVAVFAAESPKLVIGEPQELGSFFLMIARLAERLSQQPDLAGLHSCEKRLSAAGLDRCCLRLQRLRL